MSDIFISYAKKDHSRVRKLAQTLEVQGWSVFWDPVIPTGKTWRNVIDAELEQARCVVVAWSRISRNSHWVQEEAEIGRRRDILIPVLIEDVLPPLGFQSLQAADLSGWDGAATAPIFSKLIADITNILGIPPVLKHQREEVEAKRKREKESVSGDAYASLVSEDVANEMAENYQMWQITRAGGDPEIAELIELIIRETVSKYLKKQGESGHEADEADFQAVIAIARRIGLLR